MTPMEGVLIAILSLFLLAGVITLWYRRGDRKAKQEIEIRRSQNPFAEGGTT